MTRLIASLLVAALLIAAPGPGPGAGPAFAQAYRGAASRGAAVAVTVAPAPAALLPATPQASAAAIPALSPASGLAITPLAPAAAAAQGLAAGPGALAAPAARVGSAPARSSGLARVLAPSLDRRRLAAVRAAVPDDLAERVSKGGGEDAFGAGRRVQEALEGSGPSSYSPEPEAPRGFRTWLSRAMGLGTAPVLRRAGGALPTPVNRKIAALQALAARDQAAGRVEALKALKDPADRRLELLLTALRVLAPAVAEPGVAAAFLEVVKSGSEPWYLRREAAGLLGRKAGELGGSREAAVESLKAARKDANQSLHLMAGWALARLGADPGTDRAYQAPGPAVNEARSAAPEAAPPVRPAEPQPRGKLGTVVKWGLIGLLAFALYSAYGANGPMTPPKTPPAAVQIAEKAPVPPAIADPRTPEQEALNRIEENTRRQADATERVAKAVEKAAQPPSFGRQAFSILLSLAFPILMIVFMFRMMRGAAGGGQAANMAKAKVKSMSRSKVRFADVAGIDDSVVEIQEIVEFLQNPARFRKVGARMPKGALLIGKPGTGKTLLAKALAGETNANLIAISGSDFVEMFVGVGAARVRDLFETAKQNAPTIIFIDEIDAIGKKRGAGGLSGSNDEREQTLNQILVEMDGFDNSSGVVVLAATNRADVLDSALMRPGRFDRQIIVNAPDVIGREAILQVHAKDVPLGPDVDLRQVARRTTGLTGAFLANIVNESALQAARRDAAQLTAADFDEGTDRATIGASRSMILSDKDREWTAWHEAGHAIARLRARKPKPLNKLTIVPKGDKALGFAEPGSDEDVLNYTRDELKQMIAVAMGGLVAEQTMFGDYSTGPGSDLEYATRMARMMVERFGMGESTGFAVTAADPSDPFGRRSVSEATAREIDLEVKKILDEAHAEAKRIMTQHRGEFEALARALLQRETLQREEIEALVPSSK